jgi:hypothetical protein
VFLVKLNASISDSKAFEGKSQLLTSGCAKNERNGGEEAQKHGELTRRKPRKMIVGGKQPRAAQKSSTSY